MGRLSSLKAEILEAMDGFRVVDHHDHLREVLFKRCLMEIDLPFFFARGYVRSDLVSSGLPDSFYEPSEDYPNMPKVFSYLMEGRDESEKTWSRLKPYLERVRNTIFTDTFSSRCETYTASRTKGSGKTGKSSPTK